mgnify:CR=1 FL=1
MKKIFFFFAAIGFLSLVNAYSQDEDWRNAVNGNSILSNGYCDQPYVVVLPSGSWLCVFTTNEGAEGSGGQFVVNGNLSTGGDFRKKGWTWIDESIENISFRKIEIGTLDIGHFRPRGEIVNLKLYNRPLLNTEIIGNHNHYKSTN